MSKKSSAFDYVGLLGDLKQRIQHSQMRAVLTANAELIRLYWDVGQLIEIRQQHEGWGTGIIPQISRDLLNELPEIKGFSERNIKRMLAFYRAYPSPDSIVPQPVAQLLMKPRNPQTAANADISSKKLHGVAPSQNKSSLLWSIPWGHHAHLLEKVELESHRIWYMTQTHLQGWSRNVLAMMIQSQAHARQGQAVANFASALPSPQSDLIQQTLKDPYIFDFLTLEAPFHERELETNLLEHLERFLLELGRGFAFVGRQFPVEVDGKDFEIDLLFYHLELRAFVVIDLKTGEFKPEYAGKMNFYLGVVDDRLRHSTDSPSIGLILCRDHNRIIAEYALRDMKKPIGISKYELTRALPKELESRLPSIESIEAELAGQRSTPILGNSTRLKKSKKKSATNVRTTKRRNLK